MDNPFALIALACQKSLSRNYDHDRITSFLIFLKNLITTILIVALIN
jgi:hypothetical protein